MKNTTLSIGFSMCVMLAACASKISSTHDPLVGTWIFDLEATRIAIQTTTGYPDEWMSHIMRAYSPAAFAFDNGIYEMKLKDKTIKGTYSLRRLSSRAYRIEFTCPVEPNGDSGRLEFHGDSFSFETDRPLLKGAKEIYKKEA